jgi:hypothetical protein
VFSAKFVHMASVERLIQWFFPNFRIVSWPASCWLFLWQPRLTFSDPRFESKWTGKWTRKKDMFAPSWFCFWCAQKSEIQKRFGKVLEWNRMRSTSHLWWIESWFPIAKRGISWIWHRRSLEDRYPPTASRILWSDNSDNPLNSDCDSNNCEL